MLSLDTVRRTARDEGYREVYYNETSRVISFQRGDVRINVYYTTGTVGTCIDHPRQGKTQLFRRDVDSSLLRTLFNNPRTHTDRGYQRRQRSRSRSRSRSPSPRRSGSRSGSRSGGGGGGGGGYSSGYSSVTVAGEESEALAYLRSLKGEKEAIDKEIAEMQAFVDVYERRRKEEAERRRKEEERKQREAAEEVERQRRAAKAAALQLKREKRGIYGWTWATKNIGDLDFSNGEKITCVALSGDRDVGIVLTETDWYYTADLPDGLYKLLHTRSTSHPKPTYVSLGSRGRYYICFENGKSQWVGPDPLTNLLQKETRDVRSVAFGEDYDTFFVVWNDGGAAWSHIPSGLQKLIESRKKKADMVSVSLGPHGEYFLRAENGKYWWQGPSGNDGALLDKELKKSSRDIKRVHFGYSGSFHIRYS
jgi:hypothetical protein